MADIPISQLAVVIQEDRSFAVDIVPVIKPGPGEILVKVHAIAQNPSEWRAVANPSVKSGTGTGCDLSGEVIAIGDGKHDTDVAIGDRIAAFVQGAFTPRYTAFRECAVIPSTPLLKIPENISYEEAASIPLTACTAVLGLARLFKFPDIAPLGRSILVWGGSSSLGQYAIQLARLANLYVISTASPKNFDLVKSCGADVVIDYRSPDIISKILEASPRGDGVDYVFDSISENDTIGVASKTFRKDGPRKAVVVLPISSEAMDNNVEYHFVFIAALLGADAWLGGIYFPNNYQDYELGKAFYGLISEWLKEGKFKPNPIRVRPGGLRGVPEGIQFMLDGKVSGTKLVYRVSETN
ncbi:GroES-like protein [Crucibulum laeve]|uniref:GroES-like protein n=1 Tax=Crucibulum laeve TaxID=68775 RepID=A0A5C3LN73_9AGAR|nr:GroES-like protein [Crucibulum laeve]